MKIVFLADTKVLITSVKTHLLYRLQLSLQLQSDTPIATPLYSFLRGRFVWVCTKRYSFKGGANAIFGSRPATAMQVALAATRYSSVRASSRIYMMTAILLSRRCNLICRVSSHLRVCVCADGRAHACV